MLKERWTEGTRIGKVILVWNIVMLIDVTGYLTTEVICVANDVHRSVFLGVFALGEIILVPVFFVFFLLMVTNKVQLYVEHNYNGI